MRSGAIAIDELATIDLPPQQRRYECTERCAPRAPTLAGSRSIWRRLHELRSTARIAPWRCQSQVERADQVDNRPVKRYHIVYE